MKTMDTMLASHKKYRPPLSAASFYQPDIYARPSTLRPQSEYRFAGGGTLSARARSAAGASRSRRARLCSAALAVAALVAALAVLAVAALAFYMGALRPDNNDPIISFECSLRVTRGDVYGGAPGSPAWRERARRYSAALRSIYSSAPPPLRAAFAGVHVTGFGDHRLDVYFRLYLDRRKIPSSVSNLEELLKDILIQDLQSKRPAFGQIKIDPMSIAVKRDLEHSYHSESYMKQAINESMAPSNLSNLSQTSTKEKGGHTRMGVIRKTTIKPNTSNKKRIPSSNDEPEINTENLPVIQGTFQITKTEADITENNSEGQTRNLEKITVKIPTTTKSATTKSPTTKKVYTTTPRPKPFTIRSTLNVKTRTEASTSNRMEIFSKSQQTMTPATTVEPSSTTTTTTPSSTIPATTNQVSQLLLDLLTKENHAKDLPKIDTLFTVPHVIDDEPWRPITNPSSTYIEVTSLKTTQAPHNPTTGNLLPSQYAPESLLSHNTEDSTINQNAEDRIGVAEVVEDMTAIEGIINTYPTIVSETQKPPFESFPGIHNSDANLAADIYIPKPVYTSFTHPTISPTLKETENLGLHYPKAHPIPIDIIGSVIENYSPSSDSHSVEDDGRPVMRPPKDKVSTIAINVMPAEVQENATQIVNANEETIMIKANGSISNEEMVEVLEPKTEHIDIKESEENTERYFKRDPTKRTTPIPPNNFTLTMSTPHFTWELVNSSTKGNENFNKNSIAKYFNDTLQAIITKNDALFPNTTPKFPSRISLLKNITDIIQRFTSTTKDKTKLQPKPELRKDESGPDIDDISSAEVVISSTDAPPIITLMPAKSNLGINRPLRPRPKNPNYSINDREDVRSFSKNYELINSKELQDTRHEITVKENPTKSIEHVTQYEQLSDNTDSSIEVITSANINEMNDKHDVFFLTNVTDSIKVAESSAYTQDKSPDSLRLPKTNIDFETDIKMDQNLKAAEATEISEIISDQNTENFLPPESTSTTESIEDSEDLYNEGSAYNNDFTTDSDSLGIEDTATSIPEGTYKISYHVSGSVSSKTSNRTKSLPTYDLPLDPDIVLEIPVNHTSQLSAEKLKQLANLATISDALNNTYIQVENSPDEDVISHKAVSSSYTVNHAGFKILTKTYNKAPITKDDEKNFNVFHSDVSFKEKNKKVPPLEKKDECNITTSFRCESGQCLPLTSRCNRLLDCPDGEDENTCTCSDYLRSEFLLSKICDGIVDCWDFSDENTCEWCSPDQFVCANARQCIERDRVCDGTPDCPLGDDERTCVTLSDNFEDNAVVPYNEEGYLMVRKHGIWGRLCVQNFQKVIANARSTLQLDDLGRAVCKSMTFEESDWSHETREPRHLEDPEEGDGRAERRYWEVWHNSRPRAGETRLSFRRASCPRRRALKVRCAGLDCGLRPFADTQQARIVGGAGATGGAWPWQAALYRDGDFQCGATLIAPQWLLSASHCFYQATEAHWVARLGALRRGAWPRGPWETTVPVTKVHIHPRYVARGFRNDIAVLRVPRLRLHARLRPVCLPAPRTEPPPGTLCTVVGWGQLYELGRVFPDTLQEVELPVISTAECKRRTLFLPLYKVTDDMFCAGYERGGRDACLGDSGGPLMCQEADNRWYLHGVTSNGYGCARANRPGVYTKVANYMDWIDSIMQQYAGEDEHPSTVSPSTNTTEPSDLDVSENRRVSRIQDTCRGHRCPLGECLPPSSVCNGYLECTDGSDEKHCHHKT